MAVVVDDEGASQAQVQRALEAICSEIGPGYVHTCEAAREFRDPF